jgi:hypothetical protein
VLFCSPAAAPVTLTLRVQDVLAARVAPDMVMRFVP